jgi:hypothetical protein
MIGLLLVVKNLPTDIAEEEGLLGKRKGTSGRERKRGQASIMGRT